MKNYSNIFSPTDKNLKKCSKILKNHGIAALPTETVYGLAAFNNDGTKVIFTDEWGGGGRARCRASDPLDWVLMQFTKLLIIN